jgi:hypothetical protein
MRALGVLAYGLVSAALGLACFWVVGLVSVLLTAWLA